MSRNNVVSIIVPVYNAEKELRYCVQSILQQSYKQIDVILVNDGSTDTSGEICNELAAKHYQISVIHQQNKGPSSARNTGISKASGHFIQFVDADDYVHPTMTEKLVECALLDTDLVLCGYHTLLRGKKPVTIPHVPEMEGKFSKSAFLQHFGALYREILLPSPCNKLYVLSIIREHTIRFDETISMGEDLLFNLDYLQVCSSVYILADPLYTYVSHGNTSLSRGYIDEFYSKQQFLQESVRDFLKEQNKYTAENRIELSKIMTATSINACSNLFHRNSPLSKQERKKQLRVILKESVNHGIIQEHQAWQVKIFLYLVKKQSLNGLYYLFFIKELTRYLPSPFYTLFRTVAK